MTVLDTSVLIPYYDGEPEAGRAVDACPDVLRVPAQVWVEFLSGVRPRKRARVAARLQGAVHFVPFDRPIADRAVELQAGLTAIGQRLSWPDVQVAATALHLDEALLARDGGFDHVPGLHLASA